MKIVWNDPDPIKDNDYTVHSITKIVGGTALILYGHGSEAQVYVNELEIVHDSKGEEEHHYAKLLEEAKEGING